MEKYLGRISITKIIRANGRIWFKFSMEKKDLVALPSQIIMG
jgi:hypothetical protein